MNFFKKYSRPLIYLAVVAVLVAAGFIIRSLVVDVTEEPSQFTGEVTFQDSADFIFDVTKVKVDTEGAALLRNGSSGSVVLMDSVVVPRGSEVVGFSQNATVPSESMVGYQFTGDGATWYYHDGEDWEEAGKCGTCINTVEEVNEHINELPIPSHHLKIRAVLLSEGEATPVLHSVGLLFSGDPVSVSVENQTLGDLFSVAAVETPGCFKIEGSDIGKDGIEIELDSCTVTITSWDIKPGESGEFLGFTYTSDCSSIELSTLVKSGTVTDTVDPTPTNGTFGPTSNGKAISNIQFCEGEKEDDPEIVVAGECVETDAVFTITNIGDDMPAADEYRVYRNGALEDTQSYQLTAGEDLDVTVASNGDLIKIEVDDEEVTVEETLTCEEVSDPEIEVAGECVETDAVFTITNIGDDMPAADEYRVYRNGTLEDTQSYQLTSGEELEVTVASAGDEIKIEVDDEDVTVEKTLTCEEDGEPLISVVGECVETDAVFTITNDGVDMPSSDTYRVYRNGTLEDTQSYQLTSGEELEVTVASNGDLIKIEVDDEEVTVEETLTCEEVGDPEIEVAGECVETDAVFTITNVGDDMPAADEYRVYRNGTLEDTQSYQLTSGEELEVTVASNGDLIKIEVDDEEVTVEETLTCEDPEEPEIQVVGQCVETGAEFTITNVGDDMSSPLVYRVYRNNILEDTQTYQLTSGEDLAVNLDSNGDVIRLEVVGPNGTLVETLTCSGEENPEIEIIGECSEVDAVFTISNSGDDMPEASEYRVYRNDVLEDTQSFQLNSGQDLTFNIASSGDVIKVEVDDGDETIVETLTCEEVLVPEILVAGFCLEETTASFTISNVGDAMESAADYRIYRNGVLDSTESFQLDAGEESDVISVEANGDAITVEADDPNGATAISDTVVDCGGETPSSIEVAGVCVDPEGTFTINTSGGPGEYRIYINGLLDDTISFNTPPFTPFTFSVTSPGDDILVEADLADDSASDSAELEECGTLPPDDTPLIVTPVVVTPPAPPVVAAGVGLACPVASVTATSTTITGTITGLPSTVGIEYSTTGGASWNPLPAGNISGLGTTTTSLSVPLSNLDGGNQSLQIRAVQEDGTTLASGICGFDVALGLIFGHNQFVLPAQASAITNAGVVSFFTNESQQFYLEAPDATAVECQNLGTGKKFTLTENENLKLWETEMSFEREGVFRMQCTASNSIGSYTREINEVFVSEKATLKDEQTNEPIENALLTTYRKDQDRGSFELFDASAVGRENPEEIGSVFSLYLPEGEYYIELESPGYIGARSIIFIVEENSIVTSDVALASADGLFQRIVRAVSFGNTNNFPVTITPLEENPLNDIGEPTPDIILTDEDGAQTTLYNLLEGKPALLYAHAGWNTLSAEQQEIYTNVRAKYDDQITSVEISTFEPDNLVKTDLRRAEYGLKSYVPNPQYFDDYYANSLPQFYFIDEEGNLVRVVDSSQSEASLEQLLQETLLQP